MLLEPLSFPRPHPGEWMLKTDFGSFSTTWWQVMHPKQETSVATGSGGGCDTVFF